MEQLILLLGQAVNKCAYIRRFNTLMSFISDKKKFEMMPEDNAERHSDTMKKCCLRQSLKRL